MTTGQPGRPERDSHVVTHSYKDGDRVEMRFPDLKWYAGIISITENTIVDIRFDDGSISRGVPLMVDEKPNEHLRALV